MNRKTGKNTLILLLILAAVACIFIFLFPGRQKGQIDELIFIDDYEIYVNEKQNLSVDLKPETYSDKAQYFIKFINDDYETVVEMERNEEVLYSSVEISSGIQNCNVIFIVKVGNDTRESKLCHINSASTTYIDVEDN